MKKLNLVKLLQESKDFGNVVNQVFGVVNEALTQMEYTYLEEEYYTKEEIAVFRRILRELKNDMFGDLVDNLKEIG